MFKIALNWSKRSNRGSKRGCKRGCKRGSKGDLRNCAYFNAKSSQKSEKIFRASNATPRLWGVKCHLRLLGRQMPPRGYWGVKCHPGVLGRQMPPRGIGASKATRASKGWRQRSGESGIRWGVRSQNSGVRVHSVKWPGRQRRWIP